MATLSGNDITIKILVGKDAKALKEVQDGLDDIKKKTTGVGAAFSDLGKQLQANAKTFIAVGAASTAALGLSAKAAIDFESSFAGVRKTVNATEEEFAKLAQNFRDMAKTTPVNVNELNRIAELAGQLGVSGVDNLTKFTEIMAQMAVTTNLTSEAAATSFARIANIMGEPIENVDRMGSVVVELGNNFATTEAEIVGFAERIAGAGKIAGFTTDQIFAIGAAMSSVGVEAEAGGTAVQKVLIAMNTAVVQGNEDLEAFAATAGLTASEFKKAYEEDAMNAFLLFVEGLGVAGDDAINILEELGLQDQRLIRSFLSLSNAQDLLRNTVESSSGAWKENNALNAEAQKRYATTASQLQILRNNINDMAITLGSALLPIINQFVQRMIPVIQNLTSWIQANPQLTAGLLAAGAALGGIGVFALTVIPAVVNLVALAGALKVAVVALWGVLIANPFGLVVVAAFALGAALAAVAIQMGIFETKADRVAAAEDRLTQAKKDAALASDNLKLAEENLISQGLRLEQAILFQERAQRNYNDAVAMYGEESLEAREAALQLKMANEEVKTATDAAKEAVDAHDEALVKVDETNGLVIESEKKKQEELEKEETAWGKLTDAVGTFLGKLKELNDWLLDKSGGTIGFDPGRFSGINIMGLGKHRSGTSFAPGGLSMVGEAGPELINLPRGSKVTSNQSLESRGGMNGGIVIENVNNYNYGQGDMNMAMRELGWRLSF